MTTKGSPRESQFPDVHGLISLAYQNEVNQIKNILEDNPTLAIHKIKESKGYTRRFLLSQAGFDLTFLQFSMLEPLVVI